MTASTPASVSDAPPPPYRSHIERTAESPRELGLHSVTLSRIDQVHPSVRLFRLRLDDQDRGAKFNAGQWLDVFVPSPSIHKPGGFTITSAPYHSIPPRIRSSFPIPASSDPLALKDGSPFKKSIESVKEAVDSLNNPVDMHNHSDAFIELAVQKSPKNPPAAWLWRDVEEVLGKKLMVRVGGSFVWPPPSMMKTGVSPETVVLVAGGVGINPLIAILTHLHLNRKMPPRMHLLYSTKASETSTDSGGDEGVLFLSRIRAIAAEWPVEQLSVTLFSTPRTPNTNASSKGNTTSPTPPSTTAAAANTPAKDERIHVQRRRMTSEDVSAAMGDPAKRQNAVVYICGPQAMTDEFVQKVRGFEGVREENVLCEKWW